MSSTLEFLKKVWPSEGVYLLGVMTDKGLAHKAYDHIAVAAEAAAQLDEKGRDVYFACAGYKQHPWKDEHGKWVFRKKENWLHAKAFWVDIDCGEDKVADGKGYSTQKEAAGALLAFCKEYGLPRPIIVSSGYGVHAYWPLTSPLDAKDWTRAASVLKSAMALAGLRADPTRTADFASILRPPGTTNKKRGGAKPVRVVTDAEPTETTDFLCRLQNIVSNHAVELPRERPEASINDDLTAHLAPSLDSDGNEVAGKCNQVRMMRDGEKIGYEHWRGVIGILKYCTGGEALTHEWSAKDPTYDPATTQQKYDTWSTGPATCEFFTKANPDGCAGCAFAGKVKTPLMLGRVIPINEEKTEEVVSESGTAVVSIPALVQGYSWLGGRMVRVLRNKDGIPEPFDFATTLFYPTHRIRKVDGTFMTRFRMHLQDKRIREFDIDGGLIGVGGQQLIQALGKFEVYVTSNKGSIEHLTAYVRESVKELMTRAEEINTLDSFGWKYDMTAFLLGDRLYHKDGTMREVILGGNAAIAARAFPSPKGTPEGWAKGVDFMYNREGMEPMQYTICSAFGSMLGPLGESLYKGIPVALTGAGTGKGKTTTCYSALYAFGDANQMTFKTEMGATPRARTSKMGTYHNIPLLFDEVTNIKPQELSELLYVSSNGGDRERLTAGRDGVKAADTATWNLSALITANKHLGSALASNGNTQAEAVRLFEIKVDTCDIPVLNTADVTQALKRIERNMGSAGEKYIQYLVQNLDHVTDLWREEAHTLADDAAETQQQQYRYFRQHMLCTLTAARVLASLGLIQFDLERLRAWAIAHVSRLCQDVVENNTVSGDTAIHQLIGDLSPRILVTSECRDGRNTKGPEDMGRFYEAPAGRYIQWSPHSSDSLRGRLYLSKKDVREWCLKNRVEQDTILRAAEDLGVLINKDETFQLGKGTTVPTGRVRCLVLDLHKLNEGSTVQFKVISGGRYEEGADAV